MLPVFVTFRQDPDISQYFAFFQLCSVVCCHSYIHNLASCPFFVYTYHTRSYCMDCKAPKYFCFLHQPLLLLILIVNRVKLKSFAQLLVYQCSYPVISIFVLLLSQLTIFIYLVYHLFLF